MIDFEIIENGETKYLTWKKLCEAAECKPYMPTTPELAQLKLHFEKRFNADSVTVRMNGQPIL